MTRHQWFTAMGFTDIPFAKNIADCDLWLPDSRKELVAQLVDTVHENGHVLLVGEPGVGKTCVLRAMRHALGDGRFRLTYCQNATLGRRDFYRQLCLALGLEPKATAAALFFGVSTHIEQLGKERIHPVFLLDEAQMLHQETLAHLHILANYEWDAKPLLSLVLVGLPETWDRLQLRCNRSLWSRIQTRVNLGEAKPDDTAEYIAFRVKLAGCNKDLFSSDAIAFLHEASAGKLRDIDRLAAAALKRAVAHKIRIVDRDLIAHVIADDTQRMTD